MTDKITINDIQINRLAWVAPLGTASGMLAFCMYEDWDDENTLVLGNDTSMLMRDQQINPVRLLKPTGFANAMYSNYNNSSADLVSLVNRHERYIIDDFDLFNTKYPSIAKDIINSDKKYVLLSHTSECFTNLFKTHNIDVREIQKLPFIYWVTKEYGADPYQAADSFGRQILLAIHKARK